MPTKLAKPPMPARANRPPADNPPAAAPSRAGIADALLAWYGRHARTLPWRVGPTARARGVRPDPYRVWLSEIMLQQTTVKAVAPYFLRFVERWPTIHALAEAEDGAVMAAWAGLGYYSRARNLIQCARTAAARPEGRFPETAAELAMLPGVGAYTSAAIAAIAFDEPAAVVDGNVERVIARLFAIDTPLPAAKPLIREALQPLVPARDAGMFAEATMDLGATICTPKKPACVLCPLTEFLSGAQARARIGAADEGCEEAAAGTLRHRLRGAALRRGDPPAPAAAAGPAWRHERGSGHGMGGRAAARRAAAPSPLDLGCRARGARLHAFCAAAFGGARRGRARSSSAGRALVGGTSGGGSASERYQKGNRGGLSRRDETAGKAVTDIRHIVLDIGKVLVHYDPHLAFLDLIADAKERTAFLDAVCSNDWNKEQDRGRSWEEAEAEAIGRHPDKADLIRAFRGRHHMMISHAYEDTVDVLRGLLAGGYDVTLLTNFASDTLRETQERFPFLKETRGVTVSGDVRLIKPDLAIYARHAETFGLEPSATLFFDDSPKNVEAARKAGWNAELFTECGEDAEGFGALRGGDLALAPISHRHPEVRGAAQRT